jgi:hypothetical protein
MPYFYEVVSCSVIYKEYFEKIRSDYINSGWKLIGGIIIEDGCYKQQVIKHY